MSSENFISGLLKSFSQVFQPLIDAVEPLGATPPSTDSVAALLTEFGWTLAPEADPAAIAGVFAALANDMKAVVADAQQLGPNSSSDQISKVAADLAQTVIDIRNIATAGGGLNLSPFDQPDFWQGPQSFPVLLAR